MNNIMLHGATNCKSSNFGDYLYGEIVYKYLVGKGYNVIFYQPSAFFKKYLDDNGQKNFSKEEADLVIYIPGGYFGEGHSARLVDNLVQFMRFMPLGIWAAFKKKLLAVLAVGAGPNKNILMNFGIKMICNWASIVSVRDNESYDALRKSCPSINLKETGDLILASALNGLNDDTQQLKIIKEIKNKKKILLVHYNHDSIALEKFAKATKKFLSAYTEYHVVVAADSILSYDNEYFSKFKDLLDNACVHFIYNDPREMISLLEITDVVITCKLHVGVVACRLGKSVVSVACHPEKTARFYKQISADERCIDLYTSEVDDIVNLLNKYHNVPVVVNKDVIDTAAKTWGILDAFLEEYND